MSINTQTSYGKINITQDLVAQIAGLALSECYGIVGMTSKNFFKDKYLEILKKENLTKGVEVFTKKGITLNLYVVLLYGVKISEVLLEAQKRVKYELEKQLSITIDEINIYAQGVKKV